GDRRGVGLRARGHGPARRDGRARQGLSAHPGRGARERPRLRAHQSPGGRLVLGPGSTHSPPGRRRGVMLARLLRRRKTALVGAIVLAVIGLAALFAPALVPYDPLQVKPAEALSPPTLRHPFGTDQYGRDILSRAIMGARLSLLTGLGAVAVALAAGVAVGLACGVIGGCAGLVRLRPVATVIAVTR